MSLPTTSTTTKASATATALPLRIHQVVTTGQATAAVPPRPTPELSPPRTSVAAVAPAPEAAAPLALAEVPDAQAKADAPATETLPPTAVENKLKSRSGKWRSITSAGSPGLSPNLADGAGSASAGTAGSDRPTASWNASLKKCAALRPATSPFHGRQIEWGCAYVPSRDQG